jgi:hypothetical protein
MITQIPEKDLLLRKHLEAIDPECMPGHDSQLKRVLDDVKGRRI